MDEGVSRPATAPMSATRSESPEPLSRETRQALRYAAGYLELGLHTAAAEELAQVPTQELTRLPVLAMRLEVAIHAKTWASAATLARALTARDPAQPGGWIHLGYALRRAEGEGLAAARDALARAIEHHGVAHAIVHYNLACYHAQLGELEAARTRLQQSYQLDAACRELALADEDLAPLRECGWL
jgi:predicted Zn-dependent protease